MSGEEHDVVTAEHGDRKEGSMSGEMRSWTRHEVRDWVLKLAHVDDRAAELLFQQDINGAGLLLLEAADFKEMGVTLGPTKLILHARDEVLKLEKEEPASSLDQPGRPCKPYPFGRYNDTHRYIQSNFLDITESGALDLIEPCHEYKAFIHTTEETKMSKFTAEVVRFAAACMNCRTNGTIHFGIGDKPEFTHGEVLGVGAEDREAFGLELRSAIEGYFEHKHRKAAQICIKAPRFVQVLNSNMTSSDKCVIEVDIVPDSTICGENTYHTSSMNVKKAKKRAKANETDPTDTKPAQQFFVRDGGSSRDLLAPTTFAKPMVEYEQFVARVPQLLQRRQRAEEERLSAVRSSTQGSRLVQMVTGGSLSLDKSYFDDYVVVTNRAGPVQLESLGFLVELNPAAVLDFDPESGKQGLQQYFEEQSAVNTHLPVHYKITEGVEDVADKLKLTRCTSWIFCNGGLEGEAPSDIRHWSMEKGASVRDAISFLCRRDVLPSHRFLVVFLLVSPVTEKMDPLVETFYIFLQELKGTEQILCICDSQNGFTSWRDLIDARCGRDVSDRCIYELSFSEVNGTVLSLLSENRRSKRILPSGGGSKVFLEKKVERSLNTLDILCTNQCEGGNEDQLFIEENFYRGDKVSWWNFYYSEQPGSTPFIKRDKFDFIVDTLIPDVCSLRRACVHFSLVHLPGCGGTTLAKHILWTLRNKFRCAVLTDRHAQFPEIAEQVVKLLMYQSEDQSTRLPVLLMVDDFEDKEKVCRLQQFIEEECMNKHIQSKSPLVIILNCMVSLYHTETGDSVFVGNNLSDNEQKLFEEKLIQIEKTYKDAQETFYGFMFIKKNFSSGYAQGVASKTLKSFNINRKPSQLLAVLVLMHVYCKGASLSASLCEDFLGLKKPIFGNVKIEEMFGGFSTLITRCTVQSNVVLQGIKVKYSNIARFCLTELHTTHHQSKADIFDLLLTTDNFFENIQGKGKLLQDIHYVLVKRHYSMEEECQFSPLIQDIAKETPGLEEMVLKNASKRFEKDAVISQLLSRYYYLKKREFSEAQLWAKKAKELSKDNSYIADTLAQVVKHKLKNAIASCKEDPLSPDTMKTLLTTAEAAIHAFREAQHLAKKESSQRLANRMDSTTFNTSGCLGEIQVGILVSEILAKTPVFSSGNVRHDLLREVLSGEVTLEAVESSDHLKSKYRLYYYNLRKFEDVIHNLRYRIKKNFDFLEKYFVNLGSGFGMTDIREQVVQNELVRCFARYVKLFCKMDSASHLSDKSLLKLVQARQYLEMHKADTYTGILGFLSRDMSADTLEKISKQYDFLFQVDRNLTVKDRINFLYVNVVLSRVKLQSQQLKPYTKLIQLLGQILQRPVPLSDHLPLHFMAVVLLWPQQNLLDQTWRNLGQAISQVRTSYHTEMDDVRNGKWPVIHFLLGKKQQGYERLVHLGVIKTCVPGGPEEFSSLWESGKLWKEKKVEEVLCRVTGEVRNDSYVQADTGVPELKLEVAPLSRSQLSGRRPGTRVSFFLGFSLKGPIALDINEL